MNITPSLPVNPTFQGALSSQRVSTPPITFGSNEPENRSWFDLGKQLLSRLLGEASTPEPDISTRFEDIEVPKGMTVTIVPRERFYPGSGRSFIQSFVERAVIPPETPLHLAPWDARETEKTDKLASLIEERKHSTTPSGIVLNGTQLSSSSLNEDIIASVCYDKEMPLLVIESEDIELKIDNKDIKVVGVAAEQFSKVLKAAKQVAEEQGACTVYFKDMSGYIEGLGFQENSPYAPSQLVDELESQSANVTFIFDKPYSPGESNVNQIFLNTKQLKVLDFSNLQEASNSN